MAKIKFFTERKNTNGSVRYYWQPSAKWRALGFPITPLPQEEIAAKKKAIELNAELKTWALTNPDISKPKEEKTTAIRGSFDVLISTFRTSPDYKKLALNTRKDYEIRFRQILDIFKGELIRTITPTVCYKLYQKQCEVRGIPAANDFFKVFRRLLSFASLPPLCLIEQNPASRIKLYRTPPRSSVWTQIAIKAFLETAEKYAPSVALAFQLALGTAQRQSDILNMKWADYRDNAIFVRQQKSRGKVCVLVPIIEELRERLNIMEKKSIFIVINENTGTPYTTDRFKKRFSRIKERAQEEHPEIDFSNLKFIDLRRTASVGLAEAGCTAFELSAVTGHSITQSQSILEVYAPRTASMAKAAVEKLQRKFA